MRYANAEEFKSHNGYTIGDIWYPRVTKILDIKAKPGLDNFFKEVGSFEGAEDIKIRSAAHGTLVHAAVQGIATGAQVAISEEVRPAAEAFEVFNKERKIFFYPEFIEKQVWSIRYRYAGTVDALAEVDGKFGVLDIKTSTGFYPEYNLQTAAYVSALQEYQVRKDLGLPKEIQSRWILRVNQHKLCKNCKSTMREKGGWSKIRNGKNKSSCEEGQHVWGDTVGDIELREFPYFFNDIKAFVAAKTLWEWDNNYWLRNIGYSR